MTPPSPVLFTIRNDKQRFRVLIRIYKTRKEMIAAAPSCETLQKLKDADGYCCGCRATQPKGVYATVYMHKRMVTPVIVAHEMTHVALCILARKGVKQVICATEDAAPGEERLAILVGGLVGSFWDGYNKYA